MSFAKWVKCCACLKLNLSSFFADFDLKGIWVWAQQNVSFQSDMLLPTFHSACIGKLKVPVWERKRKKEQYHSSIFIAFHTPIKMDLA